MIFVRNRVMEGRISMQSDSGQARDDEAVRLGMRATNFGTDLAATQHNQIHCVMLRNNHLRFAVTGILSVAALLLCNTGSRACTGISFTAKDGSIVAARSIEWAAERLDSKYVVVPRGHSFTSFAPEGNSGMTFTSRYGFVGVRVMSDDLVVEGLNEKGLNAGLFFFPGYGSYEDFDPCLKSTTLCDFQVVAWVLSSFSTVAEVMEALPKLHIVGLDKNVGAVHWRFADRSGRQAVLEIVDGKPNFYENEIGVLTNAPGFEWHLTNLGNYVNLKQGNAGENIWKPEKFRVNALSGGSGMLGLPGDPTSPSRFVRVAVYKMTSPTPQNGKAAVLQSFKILESMVIPIGIVQSENASMSTTDTEGKAQDGMLTSTQFTTASDVTSLKFYYRTMDNSRIRCLDLATINFAKVKYRSVPLDLTMEEFEMIRL